MFTSLFFSLSFSVCFWFFCLPLFCSQEVVWCDEGLTGPVVFFSVVCSPALALDLTAGLLISGLVSAAGKAKQTVTFSIVKSIQVNLC